MKAPDKKIDITKADVIYIGEENIKFIRKDALMELIKEESKFWDDGEMIFRGLIDKLNSM